VFILAQRSEVCDFGEDISTGAIGESAPTLNVSAAKNNRAGSFIGCSLSPVGTFQRAFSIGHLIGSAASTLSKIL
jgi:hypothetical protein